MVIRIRLLLAVVLIPSRILLNHGFGYQGTVFKTDEKSFNRDVNIHVIITDSKLSVICIITCLSFFQNPGYFIPDAPAFNVFTEWRLFTEKFCLYSISD